MERIKVSITKSNKAIARLEAKKALYRDHGCSHRFRSTGLKKVVSDNYEQILALKWEQSSLFKTIQELQVTSMANNNVKYRPNKVFKDESGIYLSEKVFNDLEKTLETSEEPTEELIRMMKRSTFIEC